LTAGNMTGRIAKVKELIAIRNRYPQTKSGQIVWDITEDSRLIHYTKKKAGL